MKWRLRKHCFDYEQTLVAALVVGYVRSDEKDIDWKRELEFPFPKIPPSWENPLSCLFHELTMKVRSILVVRILATIITKFFWTWKLNFLSNITFFIKKKINQFFYRFELWPLDSSHHHQSNRLHYCFRCCKFHLYDFWEGDIMKSYLKKSLILSTYLSKL